VEARPGKSITHGRNPVGVDEGWGMMTQGRRWGANLGLWAKIPLGFEGSGRGRSRPGGHRRPVRPMVADGGQRQFRGGWPGLALKRAFGAGKAGTDWRRKIALRS